MKKCIFCDEKEDDMIEEHHIIPKCLGLKCDATVFVCQRCHKKIHKYIIPDLVDGMKKMIELYDHVGMSLKRLGHKNINISLQTEVHDEILDILYMNIKTNSGKIVLIKDLVKIYFIDKDELNNKKMFKKYCQKVGYILRDLNITTKHTVQGVGIVYNRKTIGKINKLKCFAKIHEKL